MVISIIAILIALLLPALAAARQQAVLVMCQSNMQQTYTACIGYATENQGYFPPSTGDVADVWNALGRGYSVADYNAAANEFYGFRWNQKQIYGPILSPYLDGPSDDAATGANPMNNFNANDSVMDCVAILSHPGGDQTMADGQINPYQYAFAYGVPPEGLQPTPKYGVLLQKDLDMASALPGSDPVSNVRYLFACTNVTGYDPPSIMTTGKYEYWGFGNSYGNFGQVHGTPWNAKVGTGGIGGTQVNVMTLDGGVYVVNYTHGQTIEQP